MTSVHKVLVTTDTIQILEAGRTCWKY